MVYQIIDIFTQNAFFHLNAFFATLCISEMIVWLVAWWPSGLRRWMKAGFFWGAWVRTPAFATFFPDKNSKFHFYRKPVRVHPLRFWQKMYFFTLNITIWISTPEENALNWQSAFYRLWWQKTGYCRSGNQCIISWSSTEGSSKYFAIILER